MIVEFLLGVFELVKQLFQWSQEWNVLVNARTLEESRIVPRDDHYVPVELRDAALGDVFDGGLFDQIQSALCSR